jgi:putative ABC transport system substrate-binding protein
LARARPAAVIVVEEPVLIAHEKLIVDFMAKHRIIAIYGSQGWAEQGGLIEYAASLREVLVRAAAYVDRILRAPGPAIFPSSSQPSSIWSST